MRCNVSLTGSSSSSSDVRDVGMAGVLLRLLPLLCLLPACCLLPAASCSSPSFVSV